jgi:DOPA 4,5-dioxygenase
MDDGKRNPRSEPTYGRAREAETVRMDDETIETRRRLESQSVDRPMADVTQIESWHAHVYFDVASRDAAWTLREAIAAHFGARVPLGRFHERPVGPHPMWSYQLSVAPAVLAEVIGWLALNRGGLDVFVHPNTGDPLTDHRDRAIWIGRSYTLDLTAVGG